MRKTILGSLKRRGLSVALLVAVGVVGFSAVAAADTLSSIDFESPEYTAGPIGVQNGWSNTGSYDATVVPTGRYDFGGQALQVSNARTSGSFDMPVSPGLTQSAGESESLKHFEASFQIGTSSDDVEQGLDISVSPDNGQGGRMSYLRFQDRPDGVHVFFGQPDAAGQFPAAEEDYPDIATLNRTSAHTIKFSIDFKPGEFNDVVRVFVDGELKHTGTSWESFYSVPGNPVPTVSKMLFRLGGLIDPAPTAEGEGFLIDNMTFTSASAAPCEFSVTGTTMELISNCTTTTPIVVPAGYTLDGATNTITAAASLNGPVVANESGKPMTVKDLTIVGRNLGVNCGAALAGIRLVGAGGTIDNVFVNGLHQTEGDHISGCQVGHGIEVDARNVTSPVEVTINDSKIVDYQKTGIVVRGNVHATIEHNVVDGFGKDLFATNYIASNGIQISYGASALINDNQIKDNYYTPKSYSSAGLITYQAKGITSGSANSKKDIFAANNFTNNEQDMIGGRGGNPA